MSDELQVRLDRYAWVRLIEGRLYLTRGASYPGEHWSRRTRPLTFRERLLWRLFQRAPSY